MVIGALTDVKPQTLNLIREAVKRNVVVTEIVASAENVAVDEEEEAPPAFAEKLARSKPSSATRPMSTVLSKPASATSTRPQSKMRRKSPPPPSTNDELVLLAKPQSAANAKPRLMSAHSVQNEMKNSVVVNTAACIFCEEVDIKNTLDDHYLKVCPMLT